MARSRWVAEQWPAFVVYFAELTTEELETAVIRHEECVRLQSDELTKLLVGDDIALTDHASHMRTVGANLLMLKGGLIPALKIDKDNQKIRQIAGQAMAFVKAEYDFMHNELL